MLIAWFFTVYRSVTTSGKTPGCYVSPIPYVAMYFIYLSYVCTAAESCYNINNKSKCQKYTSYYNNASVVYPVHVAYVNRAFAGYVHRCNVHPQVVLLFTMFV